MALLSMERGSSARGMRCSPTGRPVCRANAARLVSMGMGMTCQALVLAGMAAVAECSGERRSSGGRLLLRSWSELIWSVKEIVSLRALRRRSGGFTACGLSGSVNWTHWIRAAPLSLSLTLLLLLSLGTQLGAMHANIEMLSHGIRRPGQCTFLRPRNCAGD